MKRNKILLTLLLIMLVYIPNVCAMKISVTKPTSESISVEVESSDTIEAVKQKIYQIDNSLLPENQKLIIEGREMEEGRTLADYNIQNGITIELILPIIEKKYKVVLDANGGKFNDLDQYVIEKWDNSYYDTLITPTREGYTFKGYYTEKNGGTKFEMILNESGIDSDMTFYAHWEENAVVDPTTPTQPEISNPPITPSTKLSATEEIENPETGATINIPAFLISSVIVVFVILGFKRIKKEHV